MKRFFTYLGIGIVTGSGPGIIYYLTCIYLGSEPGVLFYLALIPLILAILGALIGGYWKGVKGAWIGGLIGLITGLIPIYLLIRALLFYRNNG